MRNGIQGHIFALKMSAISIRSTHEKPPHMVGSKGLIHKNIKSIAGSKGLSPLAGFGAEPQKNFAYTVGDTPLRRYLPKMICPMFFRLRLGGGGIGAPDRGAIARRPR